LFLQAVEIPLIAAFDEHGHQGGGGMEPDFFALTDKLQKRIVNFMNQPRPIKSLRFEGSFKSEALLTFWTQALV